MASYTQNIDLQKLDPQDLFDEEVYNSNAEKIDKAIGGINSALGGTKIVRITREDYDGVEHSADTIYFVAEQDGSVKQYLGDAEIGSGGGGNAPATAYLYQPIMPETFAAMPKTEETDLMSVTWEQGTIGSSGEAASSSYIRNAGYIDTDASAMFCMKIIITDTNGNGLIWNPMCYDENKSLIKDDGWVNSATVYTLPTGTKYLRMVVKKTSGNMTVSQLGTAKMIKYV